MKKMICTRIEDFIADVGPLEDYEAAATATHWHCSHCGHEVLVSKGSQEMHRQGLWRDAICDVCVNELCPEFDPIEQVSKYEPHPLQVIEFTTASREQIRNAFRKLQEEG